MADPSWDVGNPNDPDTSPMLRRSLRFGSSADQGVGFSEDSGYRWPTPPVGVGPVPIVDDNGLARALVLDEVTGHFMDISCRLGADNSGIERVRKDAEGLSKTITGITLTAGQVVSVTAASHGFSNGDSVEFRGVGGCTQVNDTAFTITKVNDNTFTLDGTNASDYSAWTSGGTCFKAGLEIVPQIDCPEDVASHESELLHMQKVYLYLRPEDEGRRSDQGYDSNGYPSGLTFQADLYADGEQTTADATALSISTPKHQITFDKGQTGNRQWLKLTANKGAHSVIEVHKKYVAEDIPAGPDDMLTTEMGYQGELAEPSFWLGNVNGAFTNRATGAEWTLPSNVTKVTGPDGDDETALQIATSATALGSVTSGQYLYVWYYGTVAFRVDAGANISMTTVGTTGGWTLAYGTIGATGTLYAVPTGSPKISDPRVFTTALSSGCRTYLYNDMAKNDGHNTI